jgi:hypothetical protein
MIWSLFITENKVNGKEMIRQLWNESLRVRFAEAGGFQDEKEKEGPDNSSESLSKNTPTGRRSGTVGETEPSLTGVPSQSISKH